MKIVSDFVVYFFGISASQINGMSETVFGRQWKWLKNISGNNQTV